MILFMSGDWVEWHSNSHLLRSTVSCSSKISDLIVLAICNHINLVKTNNSKIFLFFREIAAASGEWVNEFIPNNGKKKTSSKLYVPSTAELLKRNIKRSWTISSKFEDKFFWFTLYIKSWYFECLWYKNQSPVLFLLSHKVQMLHKFNFLLL